MAKNSVATMMQKLETLRQITGGRPFSMGDLTDDLIGKLGYVSRGCLNIFVRRLSVNDGYCGRQLIRVCHGHYAWVGGSQGGVAEPVKPDSFPYIAKDLTSDEVVALDAIKRITTESQDGAIRLISSMFKLDPDDFMDFMDKLESAKVVQAVGTNSRVVGGQIWGLARDKFSDFYQIAQAVRSGQYEFPPEPEPVLPTEEVKPKRPSKANKVAPRAQSSAEKQLEALCEAMGKLLSKSKERIKMLEDELRQAQAEHSEEERRHNVFCSELDGLRHRTKPPTR